MSIVRSLGREYFNSFFQGALFAKDGAVFRVVGADRTGVLCHKFDDGSETFVPNDFFVGFKTFSYPVLGYRKIKENTIAFLTKTQSVHRGIRTNTVGVTWSGATAALIDMGYVSSSVSDKQKAESIYSNEFDTLADLPRLLNGDVTGLVLSPNIIIEPSVETQGDWYSVIFKRALIGKMNSRGNVTWTNPSHASLIPGLTNG